MINNDILLIYVAFMPLILQETQHMAVVYVSAFVQDTSGRDGWLTKVFSVDWLTMVNQGALTG